MNEDQREPLLLLLENQWNEEEEHAKCVNFDDLIDNYALILFLTAIYIPSTFLQKYF
jgi:hypothetical protein